MRLYGPVSILWQYQNMIQHIYYYASLLFVGMLEILWVNWVIMIELSLVGLMWLLIMFHYTKNKPFTVEIVLTIFTSLTTVLSFYFLLSLLMDTLPHSFVCPNSLLTFFLVFPFSILLHTVLSALYTPVITYFPGVIFTSVLTSVQTVCMG